jgi:ATP-dependent protease HslVU (ClpYQ) peptidase subunit
MGLQTVTITLPEKIYQRVSQRSRMAQRSVADEVMAIVADSVAEHSALPTNLEAELSQLRFLNDADLWRAAQMKATDEENERMQQLLTKQKRIGLTTAEQEELTLLANFFRRMMLVRAEAAVLLKERGHDIAPLSPSAQV